MGTDSIFGRRLAMSALIERGCVDASVLEQILPDGIPLPDEDLLWDYKETLPVTSAAPTSDEKIVHAYKMSEIVKDAVAFHNMYGGYLIIGIKDSDRSVVGYKGNFDANDLCKKITGATRATIDVKFRILDINSGSRKRTLGLLYIPQRSKDTDPVQFLKDAPPSPAGKFAYKANDLFMRSREECRRASTSADYANLFQREKLGTSSVLPTTIYIENNLPAKDPSLIEFVGRDEQLDDLWRWFVDRYTAVKLLSGSGGVGKTSIAWTFCDAVSRHAPTGLDKVIWLTAKKTTYAALLGRYVDIAHSHFSDLHSLLLSLLGELGVPVEILPEDPSREDLIEECISAIQAWPCLLVVDDIDSLPNEEQYDVFRTISTIFDRVIASGVTRARALLTARLNLGAAPGQLMKVRGLPLEDFVEYASNAAEAINAPLPTGNKLAPALKQLHDASNGSPLFAGSILRLVALGDPLNRAISQYKGAEGEEVRRFAFERELESLTDSQLRILFSAIHLKDCSVGALIEATGSNRTVVRDDISALRNYHLMSLSVPPEGFVREDPHVSVPSEIAAMGGIIRKKIADPNRLENNCARMNRSDDNVDDVAAKLINQVVRYWSDGDYSLAVEVAEVAVKRLPANADIWCLLGRAYLNGPDAQPKKADAALRKADELGSQRPEVIPLRIEAKELLSDWIGIVHLLDDRNRRTHLSRDVLALARAYRALGDEQARAGSWAVAEGHYLRGATIVRDAFRDQRAHGQVEELKGLKYDLMIAFVGAVARMIEREDEKIAVWDAAVKAMQYDVYNREIVALGIKSVSNWSAAVIRRESVEESTLRRIEGVTQSLEVLAPKLEIRGRGWLPVANLAASTAVRLQSVRQRYSNRLSS